MRLKSQIDASLAALNRRDFDALMGLIDDDAALDMPDGSRVIGADSIRNTLAAFVLGRDIRLSDIVVMTGEADLRGAAEVTLSAVVKAEPGEDEPEKGRVSFPAIFVFERDDGPFQRISLFCATPL
ncbi:MAG: nuclear transport factor 2 family protein [Rhizobiaceae bacterium]|nr:nuclear transport factor 2 family protein [Rhizobiaceae bacterium]